MAGWTLGVIGGSGVYDLEGLEDRKWVAVESPFGTPSDEILTGRLGHVSLAFLPRHGRGHRLPPSAVDARANIDALKRLGCTDILSLSAVGSLREAIAPGDFVVVDQFIDRTFAREKSFFGSGLVAHVSVAEPVCPRLATLAVAAARAAGAHVFPTGCYLAMEGCDVIGMTNMPEAKLAREAELPYASVAMVTDYDGWHDEIAHVEVTHIVEVMHANAARARELVRRLVGALPKRREPSPIDRALDGAIITPPEARDPALVARLSAVAGRALGA
jgi:5'-methylthioadenosine phosphorylase